MLSWVCTESSPSGSKANVYFVGLSAPQQIKALVLHVNLSDRTYVSGLQNQTTSLKIEVLFNGQLSHCWLMSMHDLRSGTRSHHQVFAGTRVDFLAERPWIIVPTGLAPNGSFRKGSKSVSVLQRWQDICSTLQDEACERGTNTEGQVPPTAEFLKALATMHMPDRVQNMQKPGGRVFGTIDVVITAGEGKKLTSGVGYLKEPRRMLDDNFPIKLQSDGTTAIRETAGMGHDESGSKSHGLGPGYGAQDTHTKESIGPVLNWRSKRRLLMQDVPPNAGQISTYSPSQFAPARPHTYLRGKNESWKTFSEASSRMFHERRVPGLDNGQFLFSKEHPYEPANQPQSNHYYRPPIPTALHLQSGSLGHGASGLPFVPRLSSHSRLTWPQPPVGLYSVPTKPKRSVFSRKESVSTASDTRKCDMLLSKVVILGKNRTVLIEQRWHPPKHVRLRLGRRVGVESVHEFSIGQTELPGSVGLVDMAPLKSSLRYPKTVFPLGDTQVLQPQDDLVVERATSYDGRHRHETSGVGCTRRHIESKTKENAPVFKGTEETEGMRWPFQRGEAQSRTSMHMTQAGDSGEEGDAAIKSWLHASVPQKRKDLHGSPATKSGGCIRSATKDNPVLNEDCVVAYAESKDQESKQLVLRQVRGERAGVFREDYVVFATRFFVAED